MELEIIKSPQLYIFTLNLNRFQTEPIQIRFLDSVNCATWHAPISMLKISVDDISPKFLPRIVPYTITNCKGHYIPLKRHRKWLNTNRRQEDASLQGRDGERFYGQFEPLPVSTHIFVQPKNKFSERTAQFSSHIRQKN